MELFKFDSSFGERLMGSYSLLFVAKKDFFVTVLNVFPAARALGLWRNV